MVTKLHHLATPSFLFNDTFALQLSNQKLCRCFKSLNFYISMFTKWATDFKGHFKVIGKMLLGLGVCQSREHPSCQLFMVTASIYLSFSVLCNTSVSSLCPNLVWSRNVHMSSYDRVVYSWWDYTSSYSSVIIFPCVHGIGHCMY